MRRIALFVSLAIMLTLACGTASATYSQSCVDAYNAQQAGNNKLALSLYGQCLREGGLASNEEAIVHNNRGNVYSALGQDREALQDYDQACRLDPNYVYAFNGRANAYSQLGDPERAIQDYDRAIRLDPNYAFAYNGRGNANCDLRRFNEAIQDYDQALRIKPDYAYAYNGRGNAYRRSGNAQRAIQDYSAAISIAPDYTFPYNGRGNAYSDLGQYRQAIQDYDRAIAIDPNYSYPYNGRAICYEELGDYRRALADYEYALGLDPNYPEAVSNLAWLLATCPDSSIRNPTRALQLAEQAVGMERSARHLNILAAAYARAGRYSEAVSTQQEAVSRASGSARTDYEERLAQYRRNTPWTMD